MSETRTREQALADPERTNADARAVLAGSMAAPQIEDAPDDLVKLPGGLIRGGKVDRTATVRELDGLDEEALSRALKTQGVAGVFHFMDTLIACGTVSIGDEPADRETLKSLLIGDRDELALAIRVATYGPDMVIEQWVCPHCGSQSDISFSLTEDVDRRTLADPAGDQTFEVSLRKGAKALVRLPSGRDQEALFENDTWTTAQRNTKLLSLCVMSYTDPSGQQFNVMAFPSVVTKLSIPDRQKLIQEISERQPGPRYNEVKFTHEECGNEVVLALGVRDLFRDLILFL